MKFNKRFFTLFLIHFFFILTSFSQQVPWPFKNNAGNVIRGAVKGTPGEFRTSSGGRFHGGVDLTNVQETAVYAINSGVVDVYTPADNSCWNAYIQVGSVQYKHIKPSNFDPNLNVYVNKVEDGDHVVAGQFIGVMYTSPGGCFLHVHINDNPALGNTNYINNRLYPFNDEAAPLFYNSNFLLNNGSVADEPNTNVLELRENGHTRFNPTPLLNTETLIANQAHKLVYDKIDMVVKVKDNHIDINGNPTDGRNGPNSISYEIINSSNVSVGGVVENINFNTVPSTNDYDHFVFDSRSACCSNGNVRHVYIITGHPHTYPYDRFWNTRLRIGKVEDYVIQGRNLDLDARDNSEAFYPDGKYLVRVKAKDIANYQATEHNESVIHDIPVVIDNFRPYVSRVVVKNGTTVIYDGEWSLNNVTGVLNYHPQRNDNTLPGNNLTITVYSSESLKNCRVAINGFNFVQNATASSNNKVWTVTVPASNVIMGKRYLSITGIDYADNQLQRYVTPVCIRQSNDAWHPGPIPGSDETHYFVIGGNNHCSGNNRIGQMKTGVQYRTSSNCMDVDFEASNTSPAPNTFINFTNLTSGSAITSYEWNFGAGAVPQTSSLQTPPQVKYTTTGHKTVSLKVCDADGCITETKTSFINVAVTPHPLVADFTATRTTLKVGEQLTFNSKVTGGKGSISFLWNFGQGVAEGSIHAASPVVSYLTAGYKAISLTVTDDNGSVVETKEGYILVTAPTTTLITANFSANNLFAGEEAGFVNHTYGGNGFPYTSYLWDFGDGSTSTEEDPYHTYMSVGDYTVSLTTCDATGCDTETRTITVTDAPNSTLFYINGYSWKKGDAPIPVGRNTPVTIAYAFNFQNTIEYAWDFDHGNFGYYNSAEPKFEYTYGPHEVYYTGTGKRNISITTINDQPYPFGNPIKEVGVNAIEVFDGMGPGSCFAQLGNISLTTTCWNRTTFPEFVAKVTKTNCPVTVRVRGAAYGTVTDRKLSFAGKTNVVFPYTDTYTIELVQYDGLYYTVLDSKEVVYTVYNSDANAGPDVALCPGTSIGLGGSGRTNTSYVWTAEPNWALNFLNATDIPAPSFTSTRVGSFTYRLIVSDKESGCTSLDDVTVSVSPVAGPVKNYSIAKYDYVDLDVPMTGGQGSYTYLWSPADYLNNTSVLKPRMTATSAAGTFDYVLTATDQYGCEGTGKASVIVSAIAPSSLVATPGSNQSILLNWIDNSSDETKFVIERSLSPTSGFAPIAEVASNTTTYVNTGLVLSMTYYYQVRAFNGTTDLGKTNVANALVELLGSHTNSFGDGECTVIRNTPDGGFILGGTQYGDYKVVKTDACGNVIWQHLYYSGVTSGLNSVVDYLTDVQLTNDGGYIIGGHSKGMGGTIKSENVRTYGNYDYWIIKISSSGEKQWDKTIGGNFDDELKRVFQTTDGGYIIGGNSNSRAGYDKSQDNFGGRDFSQIGSLYLPDWWVVKLEPAPNSTTAPDIEWDRTFAYNDEDWLHQVKQTSDGGYLLAGGVGKNYDFYTSIEDQFWLLKINASGVKQWEKFITLEDHPNNIYLSVNCSQKIKDFEQTSDGGIVVIGDFERLYYPPNAQTYTDRHGWIAKLSAPPTSTTAPSILWQKRLEGTGKEELYTIKKNPSNSNEFFIAGQSFATSYEYKSASINGPWVLKMDGQGNITDNKSFPMGQQEYYDYFLIGSGFFTLGSNNSYVISKPATMGSERFGYYQTGDDVTPPLQIQTVSPLVYYPGTTINIPFTGLCALSTGNTIRAELSNENGTFEVPVVIGTISNVSSGTIAAQIPLATVPGDDYIIRIVSEDPKATAYLSQPITILAPSATITSVSPLEVVQTGTIAVNYTLNGVFATDNQFKLELSDANGSFASPVLIATVTGNTAGTINAQIPAEAENGNKYRVRIITTNPVSKGSPNSQDITIAPLYTGSITPLAYFGGETVSVPFTTIASFTSGNIFTAQLSDESGNFDNPISIGTLSGTASGVISAQLPSNVRPGVNYRIKVVSSLPQKEGLDNREDITIDQPELVTNTVSPLSYLTGATISVPFTAQGSFSAGNIFSVQLSDAMGSFINPVAIGTLAGTTSGTILAQVPSSVLVGEKYRVRVVASTPSRVSTDNGEDIIIGGILTGVISPTVYYTGNTIQIPFITDAGFNTDNVFTAQLSDAFGNFSAPVVLGTLASATQGTITGVIPSSVVQGTGYRVRVVSSNPQIIGANNGIDITIGSPEILPGNVSASAFCQPDVPLSYNVLGAFNPGNIFVAELSDPSGNFGSPAIIGILAGTGAGTINLGIPRSIPSSTLYKIRIRSTNPEVFSTSISISIESPYIFVVGDPVICATPSFERLLQATEGPNFSYQWKKEGVAILGATTMEYNATEPGSYSVDMTYNTSCTRSSDPVEIVAADHHTVAITSTETSVCLSNGIEQNINWKDVSGLTFANNTITSGGGGGSAASIQQVDEGDYVSLTYGGSSEVVIGLALSNAAHTYDDIKYGLHLYGSGTILKTFTVVGSLSTTNLVVGDLIKIAIENTKVNFYLNGQLKYQTDFIPVAPMKVVVIFPGSKSLSDNVKVKSSKTITFTATPQHAGNSQHYQWLVNNVPAGTDSYSFASSSLVPGDEVKVSMTSNGSCAASPAVSNSIEILPATNEPAVSIATDGGDDICMNVKSASWLSPSNCIITAGGLQKNSGGASWNAGAVSSQTISEGGFIEMTVDVTNTARMFGLSPSNPDHNSTSIRYAFHLKADGLLQVTESGATIKNAGSYAAGDKLMIAVVNNKVVYYKNNSIVHSSTTPTLPLVPDVSIYTEGGTVNNVVVVGSRVPVVLTAIPVSGGSTPKFHWYRNNELMLSNAVTTTYSTTGIWPGDVIKVKMLSSEVCVTNYAEGQLEFQSSDCIITGTVSSSICAGSVVQVPYGTSKQFSAGNIFTAQLSDVSGSFANPVNIGSISAQTSDVITATIPTVIVPGGGYRIRVISSDLTGTPLDNGTNLEISNCISNVIASPVSLCAGSTVSVSFTAAGTYASNNIFSAQLSDVNGGFANPLVVGTLASTTSGAINATLPTVITAGNNYRIRVVSSTFSYPNLSGLIAINTSVPPQPSVITTSYNSCNTGNNAFTFSINALTTATSYDWTCNEGVITSNTGTQIQGTFDPDHAGGFAVVVNGVNGCGTGIARVNVSQLYKPVTISEISGTNNVTCNSQPYTYSVTAQNATSYSWSITPSIAGAITVYNNSSITIDWSDSYTGTAVVSVTASNTGCGAGPTKTLSVSVNPVITAPSLSASATVLCQGGSILLSTTKVAYDYDWIKDGVTINGAESKNYVARQSGTYKLRVSTQDGCSALSDPITLNASSNQAPRVTTNPDHFICAGTSTTLKVGQVISFNGSDDYISFPSSGLTIPAGSPITIEFWTYIGTSDVGYRSAFTIGNQDNPNRCQAYVPYVDKKIYWDYGNSTEGQGRLSTDFTNYLDKQTHVALVANGGIRQIYLNGQLANQSNGSDNGPDVAISQLTIGRWLNMYYRGHLDQFRIWSTARTAAQIQENMYEEVQGNSTGLLGSWRFDEYTGNTILNDVSGGYIGTKNGSYAVRVFSPAGITYTWSPLTNLNTTSGNTVIASPSMPVSYFVMGTLNGCSSVAQVNVTAAMCKEEENSDFIAEIYPNPASSTVSLKLLNAKSEFVQVQITDLNGVLVYSTARINSKEIFTFGNDLQSGIYLLKVVDGENVQFIKLVITK